MIWFTSDPHFYHRKVIQYCNRPFRDLEEMHETLVRNWNEVVKDDDYVFVLGDFAFCGVERMKEILSKLKGTKILVRGNHDSSVARMGRAGFDYVYDQNEHPSVYLYGQKIRMSHFPYAPTRWQKFRFWLKQKILGKRDELRYLDLRPPEDGRWLLHGHVHCAWKIQPKRRMINVGVDVWDFRPVSMKQIAELVREHGGP